MFLSETPETAASQFLEYCIGVVTATGKTREEAEPIAKVQIQIMRHRDVSQPYCDARVYASNICTGIALLPDIPGILEEIDYHGEGHKIWHRFASTLWRLVDGDDRFLGDV